MTMTEKQDWSKLLEFLEPKKPVYCPHEPFKKQKVFLRYDGLEALYGGRAGGGKSDALLMGALQWVDTPGYAALLLRNTFADLALPGSLMDRAHEWMDDQDGPRWLGSKNTWIFPSGATITFGYLDKPLDHLRYKGAEFQYIGFDEVTEIREKQYQYLFSRLRKPSTMSGLGLARVPLRMRSASNPAPNWVRRRFIEHPDDDGTKRLYVPAGVRDNPFVDHKSYLEALAKVDPIERKRLEEGDWWAEEEGSKFRREDFKIIQPDAVPDLARVYQVRYWDTASTEKTHENDPDFTAGALCSVVDGYLIIHDMRHVQTNPAGVERLIRQTAEEDGVHVKVRMESVGGFGKLIVDHYARHVMLGFDFDGHPAIKGKEERLDPWAAMSRRQQVLLVSGAWNRAFLDEAVSFGAPNVHDDQLDAVSGAFEVITGIGMKKPARIEIIL
jgi:predicted phage terminase large subunit-like protein